MIKELREYFVGVATSAVQGLATVTTAGDVTTKDQKESRVRVALYPRETIPSDITGNMAELSGSVWFDAFIPKIKGQDGVDEVVEALYAAGHNLVKSRPHDGGAFTIYVWSVWVEAMREETNLHVPVKLTWTIQFN